MNVRSVSEVLTDIVHNVEEIGRAEIRLARAEVREELRKARPTAVLLGIGVLGGLLGALFLLLAAVAALSIIIPAWAASLVTGAALAIVAAGALTAVARRVRQHAHPLSKTISSLKENVEWANPRNR
jgi:uncharacterized membrane protein YqjE